ncbi:hypothetical protein [Thioalkalivibrio sp. HK1]|uniref:hypothetical protein n=1 Tax=Thioalkalivibrio sp. HK1 TaxID=1469245 RepID=UPI0004BCEC49|nr:hypothetical protein [Thioalkalivibrio sp. HK1]
MRDSRQRLIDKTRFEVKDRLAKENSHRDRRAADLGFNEQMGIESKGTRLNAAMARRRAEVLQERIRARLRELELQERITALTSVVLGGLVIPKGLLRDLQGSEMIPASCPDTQALAVRAQRITMEAEKASVLSHLIENARNWATISRVGHPTVGSGSSRSGGGLAGRP